MYSELRISALDSEDFFFSGLKPEVLEKGHSVSPEQCPRGMHV